MENQLNTRRRHRVDIRGRVRGIVDHLPLGDRKTARRIVAAGLFDIEWYSAQTGRDFSSPAAAALDYLRNGSANGLSPNPLFEPRWFRPKRRVISARPLLQYMEGAGAAVAAGPHPLFSEARYLQSNPAARQHPGRGLGHFLSSNSQPAFLRPAGMAQQRDVNWARMRRRLLTAAKQHARLAKLTGRRTDATWDRTRERQFLAQWESAPLPDGEGPLVSVILPVRNRPLQVAAAIRSVRRQTLDAWELLVIDDGSTDTTPAVVAALAEQDHRIRLLEIPHSGVSAARNVGLDEAHGRYVAFLDSDNEWTPVHLRVAVAVMHARKVRACHTVVERRRGGKGTRFHAFTGGRQHLLVSNHIDLNGFVATADLVREVGGFDPDLRRWVDYDFAIRVSERTKVPLIPFVGALYDDDSTLLDRITEVEGRGWEHVVLGKHLVQWPDDAARTSGRVSVLLASAGEYLTTALAVRRVLDEPGIDDLEVVVVDAGSDRAAWMFLNAMVPLGKNIKLVYQPRPLHPGLALNLAAARSTGEILVVLHPYAELQPGSLARLLHQLRQPDVNAAQGVVLRPDTTIVTAGWAFPGGDALPSSFLAGHPRSDAESRDPFDLAALDATMLACRAADFAAVGGFDPFYGAEWHDVDFCLRLQKHRPGRLVVAPQAAATWRPPSRGEMRRMVGPPATLAVERKMKVARRRVVADDAVRLTSRHAGSFPTAAATPWKEFGFFEPDWRPNPAATARFPRPALPLLARPRTWTEDDQQFPRLRWAIKTSAPAGPLQEKWGDTHFARSLALALERLGQDVAIDPREAHQRPSSYLDDVVLNLRGLDAFATQPGRLNLMWVISHPEAVSVDELHHYDAVFAASVSWSNMMSDKAGVLIQPLLQATDAALMTPDAGIADSGPQVLFVGNSRKVFRPIIRDAVRADLPVSIYGRDWEPFVDPALVQAQYLPNESLSAAYRSAGVVLNDHWADMGAHGFVSNRLFDAVACGARVISDATEGLDDLFAGAVQVYESPSHLAYLAGRGRESAFPEEARRLEIAATVRRDHSFDERARQLLEAACSHIGASSPA